METGITPSIPVVPGQDNSVSSFVTDHYVTRFDPWQQLALVAERIADGQLLGVAWLYLDEPRKSAEFAIVVADACQGKVIGSCYPRHRNIEFRKFLRQIDRSVPAGLDIHMILDNFGTHNHPKVKAWLEKHHRFHLHFTPTSSSWLNLVERWFGEITRKRIRRGVFRSVPELVTTIEDFIRLNNENPKPFVWTKKEDAILEKVSHCKAVMGTLH